MKSHETDVVILASGMGSRMRGVLSKRLLEVEAGRAVLDVSLSACCFSGLQKQGGR